MLPRTLSETLWLSSGELGETRELSAPLLGCPDAPLTGGFFRKIAGAIAMAIISRIAQMVRRSMDSVHLVKGRDRTRPDETDDSGPGAVQPARSLGVLHTG